MTKRIRPSVIRPTRSKTHIPGIRGPIVIDTFCWEVGTADVAPIRTWGPPIGRTKGEVDDTEEMGGAVIDDDADE